MKSIFSMLLVCAVITAFTSCFPKPVDDPTTYSILNATTNSTLRGVMSGELINSSGYSDFQQHGNISPGMTTNPVTSNSGNPRYVFFEGYSNTLLRTYYPFSLVKSTINTFSIFNNTQVISVDLKSSIDSNGDSIAIVRQEGVPEYLEVQLSARQSF
jgi:hypothetical protein